MDPPPPSAMLNFAYIGWFLLAPLPLLIWKLLPGRKESAPSLRVPFGRRIEAALKQSPMQNRKGKHLGGVVCSSIIWLLLLTALARPQWIEPPIERLVPTRDLLLLVDLSASMQSTDFTNASGETVNRLEAAKEILGEFLEEREGDRVGLVVFGDAAFLQAPFSSDLSLSRELLDETQVGMAGPRTALGDAIGLGIRLFEDSTAPAKTIIALTDGNDTKSQVPPVEASRVAADRDIRIHCVAIGDPTTVGEDKLDEETLEEVAKATGGRSFFAADRDELAQIYQELDRIETREVKMLSHRPRRDVFHFPLVVALAVSLLQRLITSRSATLPAADRRPLRVHPGTGKLELGQP